MHYTLWDDDDHHSLLSGKAVGLLESEEGEAKLEEYGALAESILGFDVEPFYDGTAKEDQVLRFIALQINWILDLEDDDALMVKSIGSGHAGRTKVYRDNIVVNPLILKSWTVFTTANKFGRGIQSLRG